MHMDRVDSGRYMLFSSKPANMNGKMVWDRLWFIIKNIEADPEADIDMLSAWADMWVYKTHYECVYSDEHMETLKNMEKGLYV
jgi:hypothetical protein